MKAYALLAGYTENFSTRAVAADIKAANITDFARLPWSKNRHDRLEIHLRNNQALYLYGGRSALAQALAPLNNHTIYEPNGFHIALFRAQRTVSNGQKAKQLLMLTRYPQPIPPALQTRLVQLPFQYPTDIRLDQLSTIVGQLQLL